MHRDKLQHILQSGFGETINGAPSIIFLDTGDRQFTERVFEAHRNYIYKHSPRTTVISVTAEYRDRMRPYHPFLTIVKDRLRGRSESEISLLLDQAAVYHYHRRIFMDYFLGTVSRREEEVILEETLFEQNRFRSDIASLLLTLTGGNLVLLVSRTERVSAATAGFIRSIKELCTQEKVQIIFAMDISGVLSDSSSPDFLREFAGEILSSYPVLETGSAACEGDSCISAEPPVLIDTATELLNFLCLEDAAEYAAHLYDISQNAPADDRSIILPALMTASLAHYHLREFDTAILYANLLISRSRDADPIWQSRGCRIAAMLYYQKGDIDSAAGLAGLARQHAEAGKSTDECALAAYTLFMVSDTTSTLFTLPEAYEALCSEMISLFEIADFSNHLSFILSRTTYLMFLFRNDKAPLALTTSNRGIELAEKCGNSFRLAAAYQAQGILMQAFRRGDAALNSFVRAEKIISQIGTPLEKARVYNGRGYFHFFNEQFPQALDYYLKALPLLEKSSQYEELCTTLVNIAFTYLFCYRFDECVHYLEETLRIMNFLNMNDLPFHPRFFIYCILGLAYIKKNQTSKALEIVNRIHTNLRVTMIPRHEYYKFLLAEIERAGGNIRAAGRFYENAIASAREIEAETKHIMLFCFYEYGSMLSEAGQTEEAHAVFSRALDEIKGNSNRFHFALLSAALEGKPKPAMPELPFTPFDSSLPIHFVKLDATINRVHRKMMEMDFLNSMQTVLSSSADRRDILQKTGALIGQNPIGTFCIIGTDCADGDPGGGDSPQGCVIEFSSAELGAEHIELIFSRVLAGCGREDRLSIEHISTPGLSLLGNIYSSIYIPLIHGGKVSGFILVLSEKRAITLTRDDLRTLSIAGRQVTTAIELKEATTKLVQSATVDSLTGVYNRQEMQRKLEAERMRLLRYNKSAQGRFSLMFLDLDNFKHYNDTFGHSAGDAILQRFTAILESSVRTIDTVGRLGGDEFIILIPETAKSGAEVVAQRILSTLENSFPALAVSLGIDIDAIPPDKKLGCSIGITEYEPLSDRSIDELVSIADKAMYDAKKDGKNRCRTL